MTSTYLSFRLYAQDLPRSLSVTASRADVARDTKYYQDNIGKITSLDQFLKDRRLFSIAMKAHGLDDMTFATAFMRKVLQSDLSDPKSFANKLADTRYAAFAKEFNFSTTGNVRANLTYAQDDIQLDDTTELYSEHRIKQGVAAATEAQYYQAKMPTLTSVDDLIANPRLFSFALTAAGIDPTIASESLIRNVLTSDLSDPGSVANQIGDSRYQDLAALFSFDADGSVPSGSAAQTAAQLDETVYLNYTKSGNGATPAAAAFNTDYYGNSIAGVSSVDDLLNNDRLLGYALTAYGIDPSTASTPMLRQVLTSDLSDPGSYANTLTDTRYRALAAAFNFATDGSVMGTAGAQSAVQLDTTKNQYLTNYDDAAQSADASATSLYSSRINTMSNVDDLLKNNKLYTYALEAFGLDPSEESKSKIRLILTSDVSNPGSFVNAQRDPRYRQLAAAFNFGPDGKALQPRRAQTENDELATIRLYGTRVGTSASATAAAKAEGVYYHNTMRSIGSVDELLADKRMLAYVTKAYDLNGDSISKDTLRKVLTSDPMDKNSFVNRKGQDPRFRDLAAAFNFSTDGKSKRVPAQPAQLRTDVLEISHSYVRQTMETDAGDQNEGVRLALYFQRKASSVTSALDILADKALFEVVRTALGLPDAMAQASIDLQSAMIKKRLDVADLKDPKKVEKFLARFAAMYDVDNNPATASSAALTVLGGETTTVGTDLGLLGSLQRFNSRS
jgi:Protein of unknown function (DUF1217)